VKKRLKIIGKRTLVIILILFTLYNFILGSISRVYAADNFFNEAGKMLGKLLNTVVGILTFVPRLLAAGLILAFDELTAKIAYIEGNETGGSAGILSTISPFEIFFNKIKLIDINFFEFKNTAGEDSMVLTVRKAVSTWYYVMRNIAAAILMVILIYVGIRMAISTVAQEKARYKQSLIDWVVSLALVFLMQYIILFTIYINDALVAAIEKTAVQVADVRHAYGEIGRMAISPFRGVDGFAALIVYGLLVWQTLGLLFSYFNRMMKCAFLIIISPLVTLTYAIDKLADSKAQALGNWLREYIFTVLIQPFHCIMYAALVSTAMNMLSKAKDGDVMPKAILAIMCVMFMKTAEKIIRKIFAFKDDDSKTSMAAGLAATHIAFSQSKNIGAGARTAVNNVRNLGANLGQNLHDARVNLMAGAAVARDAMSGGNDSGETYRERLESAKADIENQYAQREEERLGDEANKYSVNQNADGTYTVTTRDANGNVVKDEEMQKAIQEKMKANPGMSFSRAAARVRAERARETRRKKKAEESARKHPGITQARRNITTAFGTLNRVRHTVSNSTLAKMTKSFAVATLVGTGALASSDSIGQAAAFAYGAYTGANEFFSNSASTLTEDAYSSLRALGVKDRYQANDIMREVMNQADVYTDDSEEFKELLNNIKKELKNLGIDESYVDNIKLALKKNVKEGNPFSTDEIIAQQVGAYNSTNKTNISVDDAKAKLGGVVGSLNAFENKKNILNQMQKADAVGINENAFMRRVAGLMSADMAMDAAVGARDDTPAKNYTDVDVEDLNGDDNSKAKMKEKIDESRQRELDDDEIDELEIEELRQTNEKLRQQLEQNMRSQEKNMAFGGRDEGLDKEIEILRKNVEKMAERILHKEAQEAVEQMEKVLKKDAINQLKNAQLDLEKVKQLYEQRLQELEREIDNYENEKQELDRQSSAPGADRMAIQVRISQINQLRTELMNAKGNLMKNYSRFKGE